MVWSRMSGRPSRQSSHGKEAVPGLEAGARRAQRRGVVGHARQREIADRDHVRAGVARPRVAAAVAEGVELLDVADVDRGLRRHPGAQADLEGAVRQRIERAERQAGARSRLLRIGRRPGCAARRPPPRRSRRSARSRSASAVRARRPSADHDHSRSSRNGSPFERGAAGAERLDRARSCGRCGRGCGRRWRDQHDVGRGGRRRRRGSPARSSPRRGSGLSAQAVMKAPAVERLMPA